MCKLTVFFKTKPIRNILRGFFHAIFHTFDSFGSSEISLFEFGCHLTSLCMGGQMSPPNFKNGSKKLFDIDPE